MLGETISHYRILKKLGQGGMGEVYLAEDTRLAHRVAIKKLPRELASSRTSRQRFLREAKAVAQLKHPYVVTLHEFDEVDDEFYLITEYAPGGSLRHKVAAGPVPMHSALRWAVQSAEGLAAAHARGIVHRDIKPDNLLLSDTGDLKITDFGLARLADDTRLTQEGSLVGTLAYMAPEQIEGGEADERSDLFALGATLYELFTGRPAFSSDTRAGLTQAILSSDPVAATEHRPDLPEKLSELLQQMLRKDRADRPTSAAEVAGVLRDIAAAAHLHQGLPDPTPIFRGQGYSRRWIALGLVIALGAFVWWRAAGDAKPPGGMLQDDVLAVMHFDNLSNPDDPPRSGEMITRLLITALSDHPSLRVISRQRLLDLADASGGDASIEVARSSRARWMIVGSILREDPGYVINSDLIDVATGEVSTSKRVDGEEGEDLFTVVDRLADQMLRQFPGVQSHRQVSEMATSSVVAYRHYVEGMEHGHAKNSVEATRSFRAAVREDSTFALAYLELAGRNSTLSNAEKLVAIAKALRYADRVSRRERFLIRGTSAILNGEVEDAIREYEALTQAYPDEKEAHRRLARIFWDRGEKRQAMDHYRRIVELDPNDGPAYNMLAYGYQAVGEQDSSLLAINKYIELDADLPDPYDSRGELYCRVGEFDKAMDSFRAALERRPDYGNSLAWLAGLHLLRREYDEAEGCFRRILQSEDPEVRSLGRLDLAFIPLHRGKMHEAIGVCDRGIAADELEGTTYWPYRWKRYLRSRAQAQVGDWDPAITGMRSLIEYVKKLQPVSNGWVSEYIDILAIHGDFAEADRELVALRERLLARDGDLPDFYHVTAARLHWRRNDAREALASLANVESRERDLNQRFVRGVVNLQAGRLSESVEQLEGIVESFDANDLFLPFDSMLVRYFLGIAYEDSGWTDKAIEQYHEFLLNLEGADPVFAEVDDARNRIERLASR